MSSAADVLAVARTQLGVSESPSGSDTVLYNEWYYGRDVGGGGYPWCAVFVSWVADQAGAADVIPRHAYTPSGAAWFQKAGRWSRTPAVGSIVYYQWPGMGRIGHVGIVEAVHADGSWTAIEGNTDGAGSRTGGRVMRQRRRSVGALGGFGHPAYSTQPTLTVPEDDMPSAQEIAEAVWNFPINGTNARDRVQGTDDKTADLPRKVWEHATSGQGIQAQDRLTGVDGLVQAIARGQLTAADLGSALAPTVRDAIAGLDLGSSTPQQVADQVVDQLAARLTTIAR